LLDEPLHVHVVALLGHVERGAPLLVLQVEQRVGLGGLEKVLDDADGALRGGQVQGRAAEGVERVRGEAQVVQQPDCVHVALVRGPVQRRVAAVVDDRVVCVLLDKVEDEQGVVILRGDHERRGVLDVDGVDRRAEAQQELDDLGVPARARPVDGLHPR
jgi:hypothetical protein